MGAKEVQNFAKQINKIEKEKEKKKRKKRKKQSNKQTIVIHIPLAFHNQVTKIATLIHLFSSHSLFVCFYYI